MRLGDAAVCIAAALLLASESHAGKYNERLSVGERAPAWSDLPDVVSGKKHSLADLKDVSVVVVVFTCNSCPVATDYEDRIIAFAHKYGSSGSKVQGPKATVQGPKSKVQSPKSKVDAKGDAAAGVAVVAINVNKVKDDLPPAMKERAEKNEYPFPYIFDETQKIARDFGANFTPEFFVLARDVEQASNDNDESTTRRPSSGTWQVVYMGAMDDNTNAAEVKRKYLEPAVEAALAGRESETTETLPVGCRIRYARERRTKKD